MLFMYIRAREFPSDVEYILKKERHNQKKLLSYGKIIYKRKIKFVPYVISSLQKIDI